jgi:hypothetical protein
MRSGSSTVPAPPLTRATQSTAVTELKAKINKHKKHMTINAKNILVFRDFISRSNFASEKLSVQKHNVFARKTDMSQYRRIKYVNVCGGTVTKIWKYTGGGSDHDKKVWN